MRLALESDPSLNLIRRYGEGVVVIGERELRAPCIVAPRALVADWNARSVAELTEQQFAGLLTTEANIVLLGTLEPSPMAPEAVRARCRARGIALETMNLGAACRTYNILANEQRAVVAGLFP